MKRIGIRDAFHPRNMLFQIYIYSPYDSYHIIIYNTSLQRAKKWKCNLKKKIQQKNRFISIQWISNTVNDFTLAPVSNRMVTYICYITSIWWFVSDEGPNPLVASLLNVCRTTSLSQYGIYLKQHPIQATSLTYINKIHHIDRDIYCLSYLGQQFKGGVPIAILTTWL